VEVGGGAVVGGRRLRRADGEHADVVHDVRDGAVGDGVDPALPQLLAQLRVPVVLDVVVRAPRQLVRDQRPPAFRSVAGDESIQDSISNWNQLPQKWSASVAMTLGRR
jgi:hypothetical protein